MGHPGKGLHTLSSLSSSPVSGLRKLTESTVAHWPSQPPQAQVGTGEESAWRAIEDISQTEVCSCSLIFNHYEDDTPFKYDRECKFGVRSFQTFFWVFTCIIYGLINAQFCSACVGTCFINGTIQYVL